MAATYLPEVTLRHGSRTVDVLTGDPSTIARGDQLYMVGVLPFVVLQVTVAQRELLLNRPHAGDDLTKVAAQTLPSVADVHRAAQALDGLYFQARNNIDNWQRLTQMTGEVTLALADGVTVTVPSLVEITLQLWQQQQGTLPLVPVRVERHTDTLVDGTLDTVISAPPPSDIVITDNDTLVITLLNYDTNDSDHYRQRALIGNVHRTAADITYRAQGGYDTVIDLLVIEHRGKMTLLPIELPGLSIEPEPDPTPIPTVIDQVPLVPLADVVDDLNDLLSP